MDHVTQQTHHYAIYLTGLLFLGIVPNTLNLSEVVTTVYFMCLLPPAAYHCFVTLKQHFIPGIRKLFKTDEDDSS